MFLKSEPYGSDLCSPDPGYLLGDYCRTAGEEYHDRVIPVPIDRFISYGSWFADQLVPDVEDVEVVSLAQAPSGFLLRTAQEEAIKAARVVVATGILPFAQLPAQLEGFPTELVSHTSTHSDLSGFAGKEVLVLGAGQSALETAALLHEHGARVKLVIRQGWGIFWLDANPMSPTRLERLRRPIVRLCEGWFCWRYDRLADLYRFLPADSRVNRAFNTLGPAGAWWLRERVEGRVPVLLGHSLIGAEASGDRVRLHLMGPDGPVTEEADHVIAGTGYRLNIDRLSFLEPALRGRLRLAGGAPVLDHGFESSVPGLFFTGVLAAPSFGPAMRFVSGTHFSAPRIARRLRTLSRRSPVTISRPSGDRVRQLSEAT
jgi:hypothetical protein